jgi:pyruvate ferredoxin oxidoreductase alpha subunit
MGNVFAMNGDSAVAYSMKQINPDVVAGYPITPQTIIIEDFSEYVHDGLVDTEFVLTESEHSAMSACIGAASAGARAVTATASAGYALMWEMLYIASSLRLPIVMAVANRALSAPINIHCDHSDSMGGRDTGWIQLYSENTQEAYDNMIQAVRIGEHKDVELPVLVGLDGFTLTHSIERFETLDDAEVTNFIKEYAPERKLLDIDNPYTSGPLAFTDYYIEIKRQQREAMYHVDKVVKEIGKEYGKLSGRHYDTIHPYKLDDAEFAVIVLGSSAGTAKVAVNKLREKGIKAGLLKIRMFRPFPHEEIREALKDVPYIGVMDRCDSFGAQGGPVFMEIRSALYKSDAEITSYIYGLGGRDVKVDDIVTVFEDLQKVKKTGKIDEICQYIGVR